MAHYVNLFIEAVFIKNLALMFFLGMCTFLAVSKKVETAFGLGVAVIAVLTLSVPINQVIYTSFLAPGALDGAGYPDVSLIS